VNYVECEVAAEGTADGWLAVLVDLPDDSDPAEVLICPACAAWKFTDRSLWA
jgi:hypothetical protein